MARIVTSGKSQGAAAHPPDTEQLRFDNTEVGRIQARGVVDIVNKGRFAYIKGSPTMEITEFVWGGQVEILTPYIEKGDIEIVCELYSDGWLPENAQINMEQCLTANNNNVDAVVASNDGTAGGVVAALASQGWRATFRSLGRTATSRRSTGSPRATRR